MKENNFKYKLDIKMFLLDMDGTIYLDDELFDGTLDFINLLIKENIKYVFLTNNSSKSQNDYLEKLNRLNIPATKDNIFTSGMAMGMYLNEFYPGKSVYLVGTKALENELLSYNINIINNKGTTSPDIVVVGFDKELNYEKLEYACRYIDDGAIFLATNADWVCPIANKRYIPDCGSICQMITHATNKEPKFIGKPSPDMINILANKYKIKKENIAMVGDRVYTDIASGFHAKVNTICVLSGESTINTIEKSEIKPDLVLNSVKDIIPLIKKNKNA